MKKLGIVALFALVACGSDPKPAPVVPTPPPVGNTAPPGAPDTLGPRPDLGEPAPYTPPVPVEYKRANGMRVWLLERHELPIVSLQVVVPAGAAQDPAEKGGVAMMTANMLDEGAGKRGALDLSRDLDRLGASLSTDAYMDYAAAQLTVLTKNLPDAAAIFSDVVVRPTFAPTEWKRTHDLWENALKSRASDPDDVASVVVARKGYPANYPYAHPTDGTVASAAKVSLEDVKKFYSARWRPDKATMVVVGDINRADLDKLLDKTFTGWTSKGATPADPPTQAEFTGKNDTPPTSRRVIIVDRPDAPQSVIAVTRSGTSAFDDDSAGLARINVALGGSFTSRLNQDLREEHGWTYGAHTRFSWNRLRGLFVAQAAVVTEHTGDALKAMLADVDGMQKTGLTDEEVERSKKQVRGDLVEAFESVTKAAQRLGRDAGVGQTVDYEATRSRLIARVDKGQLGQLAGQYLKLNGAVIVIVGPKAKIEPQLQAIGIKAFENSTAEGD